MVVFVIPLRSKNTVKDWNVTSKFFNNTIRSIFNQSSNKFKCIVVCNEMPIMDAAYDERLEFISLNLPIPSNHKEMCRDKFWRYTVAAVRIREILEQQQKPENGIYVMPIDADDLLNCHIAEWCDLHPGEHGGGKSGRLRLVS